MTPFRVVSEQSQVWIEAIHGEGTGIRGEGKLEVTNGMMDLNVPLKGRIELPVDRFRVVAKRRKDA